MASFLEFILLFFISAIAIFSLIGAVSTIHSINVGDCVEDINGTLINCSLSNADYQQLENTGNAIAQTTSVETNIIWVLLLGVIVSGVLLLSKKT